MRKAGKKGTAAGCDGYSVQAERRHRATIQLVRGNLAKQSSEESPNMYAPKITSRNTDTRTKDKQRSSEHHEYQATEPLQATAVSHHLVEIRSLRLEPGRSLLLLLPRRLQLPNKARDPLLQRRALRAQLLLLLRQPLLVGGRGSRAGRRRGVRRGLEIRQPLDRLFEGPRRALVLRLRLLAAAGQLRRLLVRLGHLALGVRQPLGDVGGRCGCRCAAFLPRLGLLLLLLLLLQCSVPLGELPQPGQEFVVLGLLGVELRPKVFRAFRCCPCCWCCHRRGRGNGPSHLLLQGAARGEQLANLLHQLLVLRLLFGESFLVSLLLRLQLLPGGRHGRGSLLASGTISSATRRRCRCRRRPLHRLVLLLRDLPELGLQSGDRCSERRVVPGALLAGTRAAPLLGCRRSLCRLRFRPLHRLVLRLGDLSELGLEGGDGRAEGRIRLALRCRRLGLLLQLLHLALQPLDGALGLLVLPDQDLPGRFTHARS